MIPPDKKRRAASADYRALLDACKELLDAPHQEHFAVRLNDEENAALEKIRYLVEKMR